MAKRDDDHDECKPQPNQRLPKDHFDTDGLSQGQQSGPVRKSWDAEQGPRPAGGERK